MAVPINIPIETPGATTAKQQVDGVTTSLGQLDAKAQQYTVTAGRATTASTRSHEAFARQAQESRNAAAAIAVSTKAQEQGGATTAKTTAQLKAQEAQWMKLSSEVAKGGGVAGTVFRSLGTTFGAVGLAATSVGHLVSVAMTQIVQRVNEAATAPGKLLRAMTDAQQVLGDATSARGSAAAGTLASQSDSMSGLVSVGGDAAVLQAQEFAKAEGQDPAAVMAAMLKMRNGGMNQEQAMSALKAASKGNVLGFGSFQKMADQASGVSGSAFKGDASGDLAAILQSDVKTDPKAEAEADLTARNRHRQTEIQKNENAVRVYQRKLEKWQMEANNSGALLGVDMQQYEATHPRPQAPNQNHDPYRAGPSTGRDFRAEIEERERRRNGSSIAGTVDSAALTRTLDAVRQSEAALKYGEGGQVQETGKANSEREHPGLAAFAKQASKLAQDAETARLEAQWYNEQADKVQGGGIAGELTRQGIRSQGAGAIARQRQATEELDRLHQAAVNSGIIRVHVENMPQNAAGE